MLIEYVSQQPDWGFVEIYEDDSYSGMGFNIPDVRQLLDDAKSGKINLILVKNCPYLGVITLRLVNMWIIFSLIQYSFHCPE